MTIDKIQKVAVIGAGAMGSQIAMVCALAGYDVILADVVSDALVRSKASLQGHMDNRIKKGRLTTLQVDAAFSKLSFEENLQAAVHDADL